MIAMRRVCTPARPGRANSDSAAEVWTSGRGGRASTFGSGSGSSVMPSPSATALASSSATFRSCATTRARTAGVCTFVSSNRNARTMCALSTSV